MSFYANVWYELCRMEKNQFNCRLLHIIRQVSVGNHAQNIALNSSPLGPEYLRSEDVEAALQRRVLPGRNSLN